MAEAHPRRKGESISLKEVNVSHEMFAKSVGAEDVSFMGRRKQSLRTSEAQFQRLVKGEWSPEAWMESCWGDKCGAAREMALVSTCSLEAEVETNGRHGATLGR